MAVKIPKIITRGKITPKVTLARKLSFTIRKNGKRRDIQQDPGRIIHWLKHKKIMRLRAGLA
jgi:hypothetical protein